MAAKKPAKPISPANKLDERIHRILVTALASGCYRRQAAEHAGIHHSTFYAWLERGEADIEAGEDTPHARLVEALTKAEADAELQALALIRRAAPTNWQAAAWLLERKNPQRWGRRVVVEGDPKRPLISPALALSDDAREHAEALLDALAAEREDTGGS